MYTESLEKAASLARSAAVRACWKQWVALGSYGMPTEGPRARAIVDLEALILLSYAMHPIDRRLLDFLAWWASTASRLVSLQRLASLAERYPNDRGEGLLGGFARLAHEAGDRRWKRFVRGNEGPKARPGKGPEKLDLADPATLQVRLRAGMGVGAKADLLTFLIGLGGGSATARLIAQATAYTGTAIRAAAGDMALGRLIQELKGRPTEYLAASRWTELLELTPLEGPRAGSSEAPPWRFWSHLFPFLDDVVCWSAAAMEDTHGTERVLASKCRDVIERHQRAFELNGISVPIPSDYKGPRFLLAFRDTTAVVADWIETHL